MDNDNKYFYDPSQGVEFSQNNNAIQLPVVPAAVIKP